MTREFLGGQPAKKDQREGVWTLLTPILAARIMSGERITIVAFADGGEHQGQVEDDEGRWFYASNLDLVQ